MTTRSEYAAFQATLATIEAQTGLYLADENVDRENTMVAESHPDFWAYMLASAKQAAADRAEEAGLSHKAIR